MRRPAAFLVAAALTVGLGGPAAAGPPDPGAARAEPAYRLIRPAVLLFDEAGNYVLLFRLNRDIPRANRRALAGLFLEGSMAPALRGGGRQLRCFEADQRPDSRTGSPRFGRTYRFRLEVAGKTVLRGAARLRHSTPGFSTSFGNAARDPKAAHLNCVRRSPSFAG